MNNMRYPHYSVEDLNEQFMRFMIVRKNSSKCKFSDDAIAYGGMDRPKLGSRCDVPDSIRSRGVALEGQPTQEADRPYRMLLAEMLEIGVTDYELLVLGDIPPDKYQFLGYDVGENTEDAWSAIVDQDLFLEPEEKLQWEEKLNAHGLFQHRADAQAFLVRYLDSGDPDMGWTSDGWTDTPDWYAVIPVYRYQQDT